MKSLFLIIYHEQILIRNIVNIERTKTSALRRRGLWVGEKGRGRKEGLKNMISKTAASINQSVELAHSRSAQFFGKSNLYAS